MGIDANDYSAIRKGALVNSIGKVIGAIQPLFLYVSHFIYGSEFFGRFVIVHAIVEGLSRFIANGFSDSSIYFASQHLHQKKKVKLMVYLNSNLIIGGGVAIAIAGVTWILADSIYSTFWQQHPVQILDLLSLYLLVLPVRLFSKVFLSATIAQLDMKWNVLYENGVIPILMLLSSIVLFLLGFEEKGLVYSALLSYTCGLPICLIGYLQHFNIRENLDALRYGIRLRVLRVAIPQSFTLAINYLLTTMDTMMLSAYLSAKQISIYFLAANVFQALRSLRIAFAQIFGPLVAKYKSSRDQQAIQSSLQYVNRWILFFVPILLMFQFAFFSDLINGLMNPWQYSIWIPLLLSVGPVFNCWFGLSGNALLMTGHPNLLLANAIALGAINLTLNYLLIPNWGMVGAAAATAISTISMMSLQLYQLDKMEGIRFHLKDSLRAAGYYLFPVSLLLTTQFLLPTWETDSKAFLFTIKVGAWLVFTLAFIIVAYRMADSSQKRKIETFVQTKLKVSWRKSA